MGYFQWVMETCTDPVDGDVFYFFIGFLIIMSPIALPLYYIGWAAHAISNHV